MDWIEALNEAIAYIEAHLLDNVSAEDVADSVHMSQFYFQKGFKIMTGYSIMEYIRNRRLSLAGEELASNKDLKIIDAAYKYGYETPDSFSKAFVRFHGVNPVQARTNGRTLQMFQRLILQVSVRGGNALDFRLEKKGAFKVYGLRTRVSGENSYQTIPKLWDEMKEMQPRILCGMYGICVGISTLPGNSSYMRGMPGGRIERGANIWDPITQQEGADDKSAGEPMATGVPAGILCGKGMSMPLENAAGSGTAALFDYYIADDYIGGELPKGCMVLAVPSLTWAVFSCVGAMPDALQTVNTKIFTEWLPTNKEYEISADINIEMYTAGDPLADDYVSEIWIPVVRKRY